jgi:hypothetical protein
VRLRGVLNGDGSEPPGEWVISRICEEFGCLPSQALRELELGDPDLVMTIFELRSYARAKSIVDNAEKQSDLKMTPEIRRVFEIELEALKPPTTET